MEEVMATPPRKTAGKTPAAKAGKTAGKTASAPTRKAAAPAAAKPAAVARKAPAAAAPAQAPRQAAQPPASLKEPLTGEARYRWIAHAAYLRAEKRGFAPGHETDDWLAAEAEFEAANRAAGA
jgi:hypothetical protein